MAERLSPDLDTLRSRLKELGYSVDNAVVAFQQQWGLEPTGLLDYGTIVQLLDVLKAHRIGQRCGHPDPCYAVKGNVTTGSGEAAPGLVVQLMAQGFRSEAALGATKTDASGSYEIAYS